MSFRRVVLTVSMAIFMANLDATIVYIALPTLSRVFGVETGAVSWAVLLYLLALCAFLPTFGKLADRWGSRTVLGSGYVLFTLGSLACGFAPGLPALCAFRFLQGVGGAMIFATANAVVVQHLPEAVRGRAFGILAVFGSVGVALGAPVGGFLLHYLDWRWVFFVNVPAGVAGALLAWLGLPRDRAGDGERKSFDLAGAALSFVALGAFIYCINTAQDYGWVGHGALGSAAVALLAGVLFVVRERRAPSPVLNLRIFSDRNLTAALLGTLTSTLLLDGYSFLFPFYFDGVRGLTPDRIGLLLIVFPAVSAVLGPFLGAWVDRVGPRRVCILSAAAMVASTALFLLFGSGTGYGVVIAALALYGAALGAFFAAVSTLVMNLAPPGEEGIVSAANALFTFLGSTLGVCLFEAVFSSPFPAGAANTAAPAALVLTGYHRAALAGVLFGLAVLATALVARPASRPGAHRAH
ncbi:MAG: MFS transporter [Acidobacteria bacterium]|nr:MFS transporter [Acidobacteriota bacterium]